MSLNVDVTEEPGLRAVLAEDRDATREEFEPILDDFLATPGVAGSGIEEGLKDALQRHGETTALATDWRSKFKHWWLGEEHEVIGTEQHEVEIAAYWLTLPAVAGSTVSVSSSTTSSDEVSASLKIAGIGGGPTITLKLKEEIAFDATSPERASLTTTGTFEKVEAKRLGEPIGTYVRLATIDRTNFDWDVRSATPPDPSTLGTPTSSRGFKISGSAKATQTLSIATGTTWELGAELSLEKLGLSAKLGAKVTYEQEVAYKYVLPGGKNYDASRYESFPAYLWSVGP